MLSGSDASCGPSNPLQTFSKHTSRETVANQEHYHGNHQHDTRNLRIVSQDPRHAVAEFTEFSRGSASPQYEIRPSNLHSPSPVFQQNRQSSPANSQWVSEFAGISLKGRENVMRNDERANIQHDASRAQTRSIPYFSTTQNSYMTDINSFPQYSAMTEHQQIHHEEGLNRRFDEAFRAIETSLASTEAVDGPQKQTVDVEKDQVQTGESAEQDLAGIARGIVDNVSNNSAEQSTSLADKMQKSQFFNLMNRISEKQVILQGEEFVEQNTGTKINVMGLSSEQEVGAKVNENPILVQEKADFSGENKARLEDPIHLLERAGFSFDENTGMRDFSPFDVAKQMIPEMTSTEWWEEKYHEDDVWIE